MTLDKEADVADQHQVIEDHIITNLADYRKQHVCKLLGIGVTVELDRAAPYLCSRLWSELDIVPIVFKGTTLEDDKTPVENVDELADSAVRKCLRCVSLQHVLLGRWVNSPSQRFRPHETATTCYYLSQ